MGSLAVGTITFFIVAGVIIFLCVIGFGALGLYAIFRYYTKSTAMKMPGGGGNGFNYRGRGGGRRT